MKVYSDKLFDHVIEYGQNQVYSDIRFKRCVFQSCAFSVTDDPKMRSIVRNIEVVKCKGPSSSVGPAIVEDCLIDGFHTSNGFFYLKATAFKHVTFRGKLGRFFFFELPTHAGFEGMYEVHAAFAAANAEYYRNVDWAIDISQAEFLNVDLRSVPPLLIRRDPESQILLTRKRVAESDWENLPYAWDLVPNTLSYFIKNQTELNEIVFVAPKRSTHAKKLLHDIALLRREGIPEPD